MKRDTDKQIDDLFKNSLAEPQQKVVYREEDWDALEYRLKAADRKKVVALWLPIMSAAAVLLIAICAWLFAPMAVKEDKPQMASIQKTEDPKTKGTSKDPQRIVKPSAGLQVASVTVAPSTTISAGAIAKTIPAKGNRANSSRNIAQLNAPLQIATNVPPVNTTTQPNTITNNAVASGDGQQATVSTGEAVSSVTGGQPVIASNNASASTATTGVDSIAKPDNSKAILAATPMKISKPSSFRPQFAVSVMGAPEINGLGAMLDVQSGVNVGMLFSVSVKKFRLSSGATYSVKHYGSTYDPGTYMTVARGYSKADVTSKIMDIPLNLDYQLFNRSQNKFSVGAGLSSYIMWDQNYRYDYVDPDFTPTELVNREASRIFMSTLNLQATYTRQLSPKFGLSFQPYFKVPLKEIGDSRSKLQTAGLAVGVNWYLNPLKKK